MFRFCFSSSILQTEFLTCYFICITSTIILFLGCLLLPFLHRMKNLSEVEQVLIRPLSLLLWTTGWTWWWVSLLLCTARTAPRPRTAHGAGNSLLDIAGWRVFSRDRCMQRSRGRPCLDTEKKNCCLICWERRKEWWLRRTAKESSRKMAKGLCG